MKNIFQPFIFIFFIAGVMSSCEKKETKIHFEGGTAPVLSASTAAVRLEPGEEANEAIKFSWTNPDYKFTTGRSSHDVSYLLEYDTLGANFASSKKQSISISKDLSFSYTVGALNAVLGNTMLLQLTPRRTYTLQARITSSIAGGNGKLTSNIFTFTAKPFPPPPKVPLPAAGNLWTIGDAVESGWNIAMPPPYDVSQKFTQLPSSTDYELLINMSATGGYKLIQTQGDWSTQYHFTGGNALAGSFAFGDPGQCCNFPAPSEAGLYKLTFNFQLGTYTVVKQ